MIDLLDQAKPHIFSVIALQEVWSISREFSIQSYHKLEYCTRDMNQPIPSPNCGGGVGMFIHNKFSYEVLSLDCSFLPGVYESMWVKIEVSKGKYKIIGNVYRPNSAPLANLGRAITNHTLIIESLKANKSHKNCEIQVLSDFNINLLNFAQHDLTITLSLCFPLAFYPSLLDLLVYTKPRQL